METKCPNCKVRLNIYYGLHIEPGNEEEPRRGGKTKEGKGMAVEMGCEADRWNESFDCPKCGRWLKTVNGKAVKATKKEQGLLLLHMRKRNEN